MDEQQAARMLDEALTARKSQAQGAPSDMSAGQPEIKELLALAAVLEKELAPASPSSGVVDRTRARVLNRVKAARKPAPQVARPTRRPGLFRRYAFALASLFVIFAMLASGTGVAYAAGGSLPGDALYGVKLGYESTRLALTLSPTARGSYLRDLADERLSEIQALIQQNREGDLPAAFNSYNHTLNQLEQSAGQQDGSNLEQTRARLEHHLQVLQTLMVSAPPAAQNGLENALTKSRHGLDVIDAAEQGLSPSKLAPGQLKKTPSPADKSGSNGPPGDRTPGPPGGPPGRGGQGNGNGPQADFTPGPPGGPPGQNK